MVGEEGCEEKIVVRISFKFTKAFGGMRMKVSVLKSSYAF